jgi:hypothetical protein
MKLLFENWRAYLNERIDYIPTKEPKEPDLGETFETINKIDIIENPSKDVYRKNALLDMFLKLKDVTNTDPIKGITIKNVLKSIYAFSGNSKEFMYSSKERAIEDYIDPYRYKGKSLEEYHEKIKEIVYNETKYTAPAYRGNE